MHKIFIEEINCFIKKDEMKYAYCTQHSFQHSLIRNSWFVWFLLIIPWIVGELSPNFGVFDEIRLECEFIFDTLESKYKMVQRLKDFTNIIFTADWYYWLRRKRKHNSNRKRSLLEVKSWFFRKWSCHDNETWILNLLIRIPPSLLKDGRKESHTKRGIFRGAMEAQPPPWKSRGFDFKGGGG